MANKTLVTLQIWIILIGTTSCVSVEFDQHVGFEASGDGSEGSADEFEISTDMPNILKTDSTANPTAGIKCHTIYQDTWQTVYHEYEESVCNTFTEQVCQPFTRTSCSSVERRVCGVHNITECGLDYTDQVDNYVETECKESCQKECEYYWETENDGSKVWVPIESTCTMKPETKCEDVQKQNNWKKYTPIVKTNQEEKCELVSQIECQTIEDEVCFNTTRCDCNKVHKKVPVRVSTKVAKRKCQKERDVKSSGSSPPSIFACPTVAAKAPEECRGQKSSCWSPGVADLDCPKHGDTGVSDLDWGYCCFDGCANTCLNSSSPSTKEPSTISSTDLGDKATNPCTPNPCGTGAMCIPQEGRPMCKCPNGMVPNPIPEVACSNLIDLRNSEI